MKRIIFILLLFIMANQFVPAQAGYFADKKASIIQNRLTYAAKKEIKKVMNEQIKYAAEYDYDKLSALYADEFQNSDGLSKDVYFKLIKDTWNSYPDITYTTEIKSIDINNDCAAVNTYETSIATTTQITEAMQIYGELNSYSDGIYYLKKIDGKWRFTGEKVNEEKSFLKYGDTRFIKMDLISPKTVKPGEYYSAALTVDTPENGYVVASIGRDEIKYPEEKTEEVFRNLPDDNILERMFYANKEGKNEYNVASIGLTKSQETGINSVRVYMAGIAFIMTRVNVEAADAKEN